MQRSPLHTARESDGRGGREITGKHPGRGAQCPRPHEPLPFRPTLQAKHRRAPASVPGPSPDRRGSSVTGGSNGADRRGRAVSRISDAESLHDDVSTGHRVTPSAYRSEAGAARVGSTSVAATVDAFDVIRGAVLGGAPVRRSDAGSTANGSRSSVRGPC